jgi:hypothetical protein
MVLKKLQRRINSRATRKSRAESKARECATRWMQATVRGRVRRLEQQRSAAMRLQASARGGHIGWALAKSARKEDSELAARLQVTRAEVRGRMRREKLMLATGAPAGAAAEPSPPPSPPSPLLRPKSEKQGTNMKELIDSMLEEAAVAEEVAEEVEWDAQLSTNRAMLAKRNEGQSAAEAEARRVRELTMITRSLQSMLEEQRKELRWRSEFEYNMRQAIAWAFNLLIIAIAYFFSIIFALKFQEVAMRNMALTWVIAYGVTFAIVEPVQVLVIAVFPSLMNSDTRVGRFCGRCRFVYNELCAP